MCLQLLENDEKYWPYKLLLFEPVMGTEFITLYEIGLFLNRSQTGCGVTILVLGSPAIDSKFFVFLGLECCHHGKAHQQLFFSNREK